MSTLLAARVVEHQAHIFRKFWRGSAFAYVLNPVLFLAALGLGVGGLVKHGNGEVDGIAYLAFVTPGLMAASSSFSVIPWPSSRIPIRRHEGSRSVRISMRRARRSVSPSQTGCPISR